MKTLVLLFLFTGLLTRASNAPKPDCCAVEATKACCAADAVSSGASAPLSNRSLYQLNSVWTTDGGATTELAALRGRPVVVAMFFAQCEYACPMLVNDVKRVREALPAAVREKTQIVLVSFDTERDTVASLQSYRQRNDLDDSWTLLRGDAASVQDLAMLLGVKFKRDARGQFTHSNLITVLNSEGEMIQQRAGLQGDVSELAAALVTAANGNDVRAN
jgi:protein SCO1/2